MLMHCAADFGQRLKHARKDAGLSVAWIVKYINGYLICTGLRPIGVQTYYAWERIGTPREASKAYPHPAIYKILLIPLDITGYFLFNGAMGGLIIKRRSDVPGLKRINYGFEQIHSIQHRDARAEFNRVYSHASESQQRAIMLLLQAIR